MEHTPVYIDIILLVNLVMDFLILWAAGKLAGIEIRYGRILTASILGAIYSAGCIFSNLSLWYDFPVKIIISAIIVILAYWPDTGRLFLKAWAYFYGVSFAMAGAVLGFHTCLGLSVGNGIRFFLPVVGGGIICAVALGAYGDRLMKERVVPNLLKCTVGMRFGSAWCQGQGSLIPVTI